MFFFRRLRFQGFQIFEVFPPVLKICDANIVISLEIEDIVIKNELFHNFSAKQRMMLWFNLRQHNHSLAQFTPVSSIRNTNCMILQYEDCDSQTLC